MRSYIIRSLAIVRSVYIEEGLTQYAECTSDSLLEVAEIALDVGFISIGTWIRITRLVYDWRRKYLVPEKEKRCSDVVEVKRASENQIDSIKKLFDRHKNELGFVVKSGIINSIRRNELLVALLNGDKVVGVVQYRHRKDGQTTLYSIVVDESYRLKAVGTSLLNELKSEAFKKQQKKILLKCPVDLAANKFYEAQRFSCAATEKGKHRSLNIWTIDL